MRLMNAARRANRAFPAERRRGRRRSGRDASSKRRSATASRSRTCATRRACGPTATAARAWWRSRASACWRRRAAARLPPGMEVSSVSARARCTRRRSIVELLAADVPERVYKPDSELALWQRQLGIGKPRFAARAQPAAGRLASGDGGQPRRLHPVHALRARVPRGAGQRRDRLRVPRRAFEDRVRSRRSDGRVDVCRVRRMRAGVPHRRARAGEGGVPRAGRQEGGVGLPVLRRGLPAHLSREATTRSSASRAATAPRTTSGCA